MTTSSWKEFLSQLSREFIAADSRAEPRNKVVIPAEMVAAEWLGYPPASEAQIQQLEVRIGKQLSPSYRSFLQVSNGWLHPGRFIYDLLPVTQVAWFRDLHADWLSSWVEGESQAGERTPVSREEHCVYGPEQRCEIFRHEYWEASLAISEEGDSAIYLLNPEVVDSNGEWEAWFFANWGPGADRYRSFWEMMQQELEALVRDREESA